MSFDAKLDLLADRLVAIEAKIDRLLAGKSKGGSNKEREAPANVRPMNIRELDQVADGESISCTGKLIYAENKGRKFSIGIAPLDSFKGEKAARFFDLWDRLPVWADSRAGQVVNVVATLRVKGEYRNFHIYSMELSQAPEPLPTMATPPAAQYEYPPHTGEEPQF